VSLPDSAHRLLSAVTAVDIGKLLEQLRAYDGTQQQHRFHGLFEAQDAEDKFEGDLQIPILRL